MARGSSRRPDAPLSSPPSFAATSQHGFTLIETIVAMLIVGLISVATFTGFNVLTRYGSTQRQENSAALLAAQSQEALRTDPATALDSLVYKTVTLKEPHVYTQTVQGLKYTITQKAEFDNSNNTSPVCSASGAVNEESNYIRIESAVRWATLAANRPSVTETSVITPPIGSALEVDVYNQAKPAEPVPGVTVIVDNVQTTTNEHGCVIYNGIPATSINVEAYKTGYVTKDGNHIFFAEGVPIAPDIISHEDVTLAPAGAIAASFQYKGGSTWTHKNNAGENVTEKVTGDTFVAQNTELLTPSFVVGSTNFLYNAANYTYAAQTGKYEESAQTARESAHYPEGDLFPYPLSWNVYAGDCPANNPETDGVSPTHPIVLPGSLANTSVPMSYVTLNVYKGTKTSEGFITGSTFPVKVTNVACTEPASQAPIDSYETTYTHANNTTLEAHLERPFQPFGKQLMCFYDSALLKSFSATYSNVSAEGSKVNVFLGDGAGTYVEGTEPTKVSVTVKTAQLKSPC